MTDVLPYIDYYFNGELSTEEKRTFEERCLADPGFARMVAFYISLQEHSQQQWAARKKQQFDQLEAETFSADETSLLTTGVLKASEHYWKEEETGDINTIEEGNSGASLKEVPFVRLLKGESLKNEESKIRPLTRWKWLAVAALMGVIAGGIILYVQSHKQGNTVATNAKEEKNTKSSPALNHSYAQNNVVVDSAAKQTDKKKEASKKGLDRAEQQQLFAQNFVPDAPPKQENDLLLLEDAFKHYEKGNYKQASAEYEEAQKQVESFTTRAPENEQDEAVRNRILFYAHYYDALSYLVIGNTTEAIRVLKAIKESPDRYWQCKQRWYLALAYIKTGEIAKAADLLQQVATSKQAREIQAKGY